jgi:excisionase family DNA binding protein
MAPDQLLRPDQVAARLNISRASVYRLLDRGALRGVRLGDGPKAHLRVEPEELDRFVSRSTIGAGVAERATRLVESRGQDPDDANAYAEALRELGYESEVFIDRTAQAIAADVEAAHRAASYRTVGTHQRTGSDLAVDVEKVVNEELARLPFPWPVGVQRLGVRGVGREALRILHDKGLTEYDEADYRKAVKQAIREAINPKRELQ